MTTTPLGLPAVGRPRAAVGGHCQTCRFYAGPDGAGGPATVEPLCSGANSDCSYCGCATAEDTSRSGPCARCPIRCSERDNLPAWLADLGGTLNLDDLVCSGTLPADLPAFIPQVDGSAVTQLDAGLGWGAYAVGLRRVVSFDTNTVYPRFTGADAHTALALRPDQKAVLVGYGTDPHVEGFWTWRRANRLVETIAAGGWDVVLTPNYSIYGNWPRMEHLINIRRSAMIAAEFAAAGVCAVPNLYWFRLEDLRRQADWVWDNELPAVAINAQTVRENQNFETWLLPGLAWLAENLPAQLPVIITGLSRADRIATAVQLLGDRLTLVSQNAHQYALHGAIMTANGREDVHARPADAFAATVRYMAGLLPDRSGGRP